MQSRTMNARSESWPECAPLSLDIQMLAAMAAVTVSFLSLLPAYAIRVPSELSRLTRERTVSDTQA